LKHDEDYQTVTMNMSAKQAIV